MPSFASLTLLLGLTSASAGSLSAATSEDARDRRADTTRTTTVEHGLRRGVLRGKQFNGWRRPLVDEAMQEAWCLLLEHHPDVLDLSERELASHRIEVTRRDGTVRVQPLETRLAELGAIARNTVLRDNHLNRQTSHQPVRFSPVDDEVGYQLRRMGQRTPSKRSDG